MLRLYFRKNYFNLFCNSIGVCSFSTKSVKLKTSFDYDQDQLKSKSLEEYVKSKIQSGRPKWLQRILLKVFKKVQLKDTKPLTREDADSSSSDSSWEKLAIPPYDSLWEKLAIPPNEYDVVVNDINEAELKEIGDANEVQNLSTGSFSSPAFPVSGVIYGLNLRFMICLVCQRAEKPSAPIVNVWFLVDTGSPYTYLTEKTMHSLFGPGNELPSLIYMAIQDQNSEIECHISQGHFTETNILGVNALRKLELSILVNWNKGKKDTFKLVK